MHSACLGSLNLWLFFHPWPKTLIVPGVAVHTWHPSSWVASEGQYKLEASLDNLLRHCLMGESAGWQIVGLLYTQGSRTGLESLCWGRYGKMGLLVFFLLAVIKYSDQSSLGRKGFLGSYFQVKVHCWGSQGRNRSTVSGGMLLLAHFQAYTWLALLYVLGPQVYRWCHGGLNLPTSTNLDWGKFWDISSSQVTVGCINLIEKVMTVHSHIKLDFQGTFVCFNKTICQTLNPGPCTC